MISIYREEGDKSRTWGAALISAVAAGLLYSRLLRSTGFSVDDFAWMYQRIPGYLDALAGGQLPPRTFPLAFHGAGYAFPHFYPPLSHWVATALAAGTSSIVWGVHLSFYAAIVLSSIFMFYLCRRLGGSANSAVVCSFIYAALPYHVADVFLRGALAESWAFVWFPAIVLGGLRTLDEGRVSVTLALAVCALWLSHTTIALYFALACPVALYWIGRHYGAVPLMRTIAACCAGTSAALWYLLPLMESLPWVRAGNPTEMFATEAAVRAMALRPGIRYFLFDLPQWVMVGVALAFARRPHESTAWGLRVLVIAAVYTVYAYLPGFFQPVLPDQLAYIQFPFRVLTISGFLCVVALSLLLRTHHTRRVEAVVLGVAVAVAAPFALLFGGRQEPVTSHAAGAVTFTVVGEYLPSRVNLRRAADVARKLRAELVNEYRIESGVAGLTISPIGSHEPRNVVLPLHYYPFYGAQTSDGVDVPVDSYEGYARVRVGATSVRVATRNPMSFWIGLILGAGCVSTLALWSIMERRSRNAVERACFPTG